MLKQRIITALILLPIALGGFFLLDGAWFALFIGAVVTLGAWEWARLAGLAAQPQRVAYAAVVAALLYGAWLLPALAPWLLGAAVLWWLAATSPVLSMVAYRYASEGFMQFANAITLVILVICLAASLAAHLIQTRVQKWKQ